MVIGWRWDEVQMYIRNSYLSSLSFAHFFFLSTTGVIVIKNGRFSGHVIKDFITFEPNDLLKPPVDCMIKFQACCQSSPPLAIQMNYVYTSAWRSNYKAWLLLCIELKNNSNIWSLYFPEVDIFIMPKCT